MLGIKGLFLAFFLFSFFYCNSAVQTEDMNTNQPPISPSALGEIPKDLEITLNRTSCYGNCPVYKLTVKSDGSVLFEGEKFTKTTGKAESKISEDKVRKLIKEFENADYFNLNGEYNCYQMTDNPSAITSIQINSKKKNVDHYYGCKQGSADFVKELSKLENLENKIDEIVESKRWIGK